MDLSPVPVECYIGSFKAPLQEAYLEKNGFSRGMILFAIPSYGVLFKCRAEGRLLDMEFGAFFALLRFIKTSLGKENIKSLKILSSNPEFVFTVMNRGPGLENRPRREKMIQEYRAQFDIATSLVPAAKNQTRLAPNEFSSTPQDQTPPVKASPRRTSRVRFQPFQKGLEL